MEHTPVSAELTASEEFSGLAGSDGRLDQWLVRDGAYWLVARSAADIRLVRVSSDQGTVLDTQHSWAIRALAESRSYCSPAPDGALAASTREAVTVYDADGQARWTFPHSPWPSGSFGACCPDPTGRYLLAAVPAATLTDQGRRQDACIALDLKTGEVVAETVMPSSDGTYEFQQGPTGAAEVFLNAAQGQEEAYSLLVSLTPDTALHLRTVGTFDEPFTGSCIAPGDFLTISVGGDLLSRYAAGAQEPLAVETSDVLPDALVFMGRPGYVDGDRILAAAGEDPWGEEARHFILDAETLTVRGEVHYPDAVDCLPVPLGDGTWLTLHGDTVRRWRG
ncbi:hypothetical protein ACIRNI_24940 [Streptomyces sp. NPDC093546]|uniref:hypothetical protein n=1 Tax=Streptomyces sp. NPDC093546 TaxID=3366040 RepID=UPI00382E25CE